MMIKNDLHANIRKKLDYFVSIKKIPNIIFHGESGSGKRTLVENFIDTIYAHDRAAIQQWVMYVPCSQGKGIKFIREDIKFFAKTNIQSHGGSFFKTIVLLNADKLTMDAQSALRRCIEIFSHNTRFFIIAEEKYNLMKPILSRFCEIFVPLLQGNLHRKNIQELFGSAPTATATSSESESESLADKVNRLYDEGVSSLDLIKDVTEPDLLFRFHSMKCEYRNEKMLMYTLLYELKDI